MKWERSQSGMSQPRLVLWLTNDTLSRFKPPWFAYLVIGKSGLCTDWKQWKWVIDLCIICIQMAFQPHMLWFHKHVSYPSYALLTSGGLTAWLPPHISFFIAFPFLTTYFPLFPVQVWTFIHGSHLSSCSSLSQEKTINFIFAVLGFPWLSKWMQITGGSDKCQRGHGKWQTCTAGKARRQRRLVPPPPVAVSH